MRMLHCNIDHLVRNRPGLPDSRWSLARQASIPLGGPESLRTTRQARSLCLKLTTRQPGNQATWLVCRCPCHESNELSLENTLGNILPRQLLLNNGHGFYRSPLPFLCLAFLHTLWAQHNACPLFAHAGHISYQYQVAMVPLPATRIQINH